MQKRLLQGQILRAGLLTALFSCSTTTLASGFYLPFNNSADLGEAFAGGAALAQDASTNYENAAGLVLLPHQQIVISAVNAAKYTDFRGTNFNPGYGLPSYESGGAHSSVSAVIPGLHYALPVNDRWAFGISVTAPYGLGNDYSDVSIARYNTTASTIKTIDIGPSVAYKVTDKLSIALGPDALWIDLNLKNMVRTQPATTQDSLSLSEASSWGYGWHGGVLYQFTPTTRVGLSYHSQVVEQLRGDSKFYVNGGLAFPSGVISSDTAKSTLPLPPLTTLSAYHEITPQWAVMGSINYMEWSVYKKDRIQNVATPLGLTTVVVPKYFQNTWRYALGTSYAVSKQWLLRTGVDYEQGVSNNTDRDLLLPDGDAIGVFVGAHYQPTSSIGLDAGYSHRFFENVKINNTSSITGNTLVGDSRTNTDVIGLQVDWALS